MDQNPQQCQPFNQLDVYSETDLFEDMPLSGEFLDGFGVDPFQDTTPGGLPSPNFSNPDLPRSGQQSPFLPCPSTLGGRYGSQPSDRNLGADSDSLGSHLLQQSHGMRANTGSSHTNSQLDTDQSFLSSNNDYPITRLQQGTPSTTSSSPTNGEQYLPFTAPSEDSLDFSDNSFQSYAGAEPSNDFFEQMVPVARPMSTPMPVGPKFLNNTSFTSVSANLQHSPASKLQPYPSHLRQRINSGPLQYSPFITAGQVPENMSSSYGVTDRQEPNASTSNSDYSNVQRSSNRPPLRRVTSAQHQNRGSPVSHNYQPFQESSLRTSVTSTPGESPWEAEQVQGPRYPEPQPMFHEQSSGSPYTGHHLVSRPQGSSSVSYSPEQYRMQPTDSQDVSLLSQRSIDFGFSGSGPVSVKGEDSSPDSQFASPKPQKKRGWKQEFRNNDASEGTVDPFELQTADLMNLDPIDHNNAIALIHAMHNTDNVEDNSGMQKTWEKIRRAKAARISEVCVELLNLTKQAQQQNPTPLGEKRPLNQYASFQKRFDALCETLTYQKTVCKHLIEPPYSFGVVDDPLFAKDRVKNNRRVNYMKAEAIRLGREHLGEKGQGKGRPTLKSKKRGHAQMDDSQDDGDLGEEPLSDGETDVSPRMLRPKSARPKPHTPTRPKPSTNSNQHQLQSASVQASYLPQAHNLGDPFAPGPHQNGYIPTQQTQAYSDYDRMIHGLAESQKMPTLNQHHGFQPGNESGPVSYGDNSTGGSESDGLGGTHY